jgi:hypothetical protein
MPKGDCAEVAALLVIDYPTAQFPDYLVCHGEPVGRGEANGGAQYFHAWVESPDGTVVIDRSNGLDVTMPRAVYYAIGQIDETEVDRYTADEVRRLIVDTGHWGPWDEA